MTVRRDFMNQLEDAGIEPGNILTFRLSDDEQQQLEAQKRKSDEDVLKEIADDEYCKPLA